MNTNEQAATATTTRITLLQEVRDEFLANYPRGRRMIGVEGFPGAGADTVADELAASLEEAGVTVVRASMRDFFKPEAERGPGDQAYDQAAFRRRLIDPWRKPQASEATAPADAVLVVDGAYLLDSLKGIWHYVLYVDAAQATADDAYLARATPFLTAAAVLDVTDPDAPTRVLSDSC
ncbi:hypothetical protein GCM10027568_34460 [Humibacter soli]